MNISMLLDVAAAMDPDHTAASDGVRSLTLSEVRERALGLASQLAQVPGGDLAFMDTNSVGVVVALFGAAYADRAFVPLNYRADAALVKHYLETLGPGAVVAGDRYRSLFERAAVVWRTADILDTPQRSAGMFAGDVPSTPAVRIFTSGTTSAPKAASLQHANLASYVLGSTAPLGDAGGATLVAAPNYHIATVATVLTSVYSGRRIVFMDRFTAEDWLEIAAREKVTHAFVVPTMLQRIVDAIEDGVKPPRDLVTLAYGGSAAPRSTVEAALRAFDQSTGFVNAYGLTETSSTLAVLGPEDHRAAIESDDPAVQARLVSAGRPLPGIEVRISAGSEILVRGEQVSGAYGDDRVIDSDGWFHTGDLGRIDEDGYLFTEGRMDDMIIRGGENISPLEIEEVLLQSPEVRAAAVVGVTDPEWGQRVMAAVELEAGIDTEVLRARLLDSLPSFKRPEKIVVVESLPRTDLGKLQRRKVRVWMEQDMSDETTTKDGQ